MLIHDAIFSLLHRHGFQFTTISRRNTKRQKRSVRNEQHRRFDRNRRNFYDDSWIVVTFTTILNCRWQSNPVLRGSPTWQNYHEIKTSWLKSAQPILIDHMG